MVSCIYLYMMQVSKADYQDDIISKKTEINIPEKGAFMIYNLEDLKKAY